MLDDADPDMVARMERDLAEMNQLIGDMLTFARALQADERLGWDLNQMLTGLAEQASRLGPVEWTPGDACVVKGERQPRAVFWAISSTMQGAMAGICP